MSRSVFSQAWVDALVGGVGVAATAASLDLTIALLAGFRFRTDSLWLLGVSVVGIGLIGLGAGVFCLRSRRFGRWTLALAVPAVLSLGSASVSAPGWCIAVGGVCWLTLAALADWRKPREATVGAVALLACLGACGAALWWPVPTRDVGEPELPAARGRPDVVLIVLDTVRADHIALWGYERSTMPWLESFAKGATVYERALSASSWTLPSHATLFTGLLPESHGADRGHGIEVDGEWGRDARATALPSSALTLAEILSNAGYATGAVCANTAYLDRSYGLAQGFHTFIDTAPYRDVRPFGVRLAAKVSGRFRYMAEANSKRYRLAPEVTGPARSWWESAGDNSRFLFMNFMEAHSPNYPEPAFRNAFPLSGAEANPDSSLFEDGKLPFEGPEKSRLIDVYDAELRSLDYRLEELFQGLGGLSDALVIVTADHGESFGEHGFLGHGRTLTEPEVHVPLIIKFPGQEVGVRVTEPVHAADVFATVVEVVGEPVPVGIFGRSLVHGPTPRGMKTSLTRPDFLARRLAHRRDHHIVDWNKGRWKLEVWDDGTTRLFDLLRDPGEISDVSGHEVVVRDELLAELMGLSVTSPLPKDTAKTSDEDLDALRALGYIE
jgi:arylsulfatase A-like enzyme